MLCWNYANGCGKANEEVFEKGDHGHLNPLDPTYF